MLVLTLFPSIFGFYFSLKVGSRVANARVKVAAAKVATEAGIDLAIAAGAKKEGAIVPVVHASHFKANALGHLDGFHDVGLGRQGMSTQTGNNQSEAGENT